MRRKRAGCWRSQRCSTASREAAATIGGMDRQTLRDWVIRFNEKIASKVTPGAHAIVLLDQAGWHGAKALKVSSNLSLMPLPPRAPELNGQENIWQFMRQNWLSNRVFQSFNDIVDHCCYAWNTLIDQPWRIMSIARRDWTSVGNSM